MAKYGKFNTAAALFEAYTNLEKEFTRKSQQLSQVQKQLTEVSEHIQGTSASASTTDKTDTPPTKKEQEANRPLKVNLVPNEFTRDSSLNEKGLDRNLEEAADGSFAAYLADNQAFLEKYVLGNEKIANTVFQAVLSRLQNNRAPKTIGGAGGFTPLAPPTKPKSLAEAAELAKSYFK